MGIKKTKGRLHVLPMFLALLLAPLALASGSDLITGHSGHAVTPIFDTDDLAQLTGWDRESLSFGQDWKWNGLYHSIAADETGYVYAIAYGSDPGDDLSHVAGVVGGSDAASLESLYRYEYDGGDSWKRPFSLAVATFDVGDGLIDVGDVVLLSQVVTGLNSSEFVYSTLIQAFDPSDPAGTIRTVYDPGTWIRSDDMLLDSANEAIVMRSESGFVRITHDAVSQEMEEEYVEFDVDIHSRDLMAIDDDGNLYVDARYFENGKNVFRILAVDAQGNTSDYAYPKGGPGAYMTHQIDSFTFSASGKLWLADYNKRKSPSHYLAKRNNKGKFSWKKRIAGWEHPADVRILVGGLDGLLYANVRGKDANDDTIHAIYSID